MLSFLPSFALPAFLIAGAACATAPIIIHLLNRRRYRVVHWAAMPFLREALQRNRKIMQMRDIILLILRTAAVLLFGAAIARPFFSTGKANFDTTKPLHAILAFDNSLSMGYTHVDGTLLDKAKDRAKQYIDELPEGSLVTVIPLCGTETQVANNAYAFKDKALIEAIDGIETVDRSATVKSAAIKFANAEAKVRDLAHRRLLFTDQQEATWAGLSTEEQFNELGSLQVIDVSTPDWENAWISDLRIQDGLADIETPTTFVVEVEHSASETAPRKQVQVSFYVGDEMIAEKSVALDGASDRKEVLFEYTFSTVTPSEGQPEFVPVRAVLSADKLHADNERHLVVPVLASVPVVFVDQYGEDEENPKESKLGETRDVRQLLAPRLGRSEMQRQLIKVKHITIDDLDQSVLEDARLVIIGGVRNPRSEETVQLLRDYVKQGGQLVIAAGGDFNPRDWTELAWLDGGGILPAPLSDEPIGSLPDDSVAQLNPVYLSYNSMRGDRYFQLGGYEEQQLKDLYEAEDLLFFRYVEAQTNSELSDKLREGEAKRLEAELTTAAEAQRLHVDLAKKEKDGELDAEGRKKLTVAEEEARKLHPTWLRWASPAQHAELPTEPAERTRYLEALAAQTLPKVRARFTSPQGPPFLIERQIGRHGGKVIFVATSLHSSWNVLPKTDTFFIYDRILRSMIVSTLQRRNFPASERITLPLLTDDRELEVELQRPGREDNPQALNAGNINPEQRGVEIDHPLQRGLYRVVALKPAISADAKATKEKAWELLFTVNGGGAEAASDQRFDESDLTTQSKETFDRLASDSKVTFVTSNETISLAGAQISGQNVWKWWIGVVLVFLLIEIALLAWPSVKASMEARQAEGAPS